jgi:hypothetical protein
MNAIRNGHADSVSVDASHDVRSDVLLRNSATQKRNERGEGTGEIQFGVQLF